MLRPTTPEDSLQEFTVMVGCQTTLALNAIATWPQEVSGGKFDFTALVVGIPQAFSWVTR